MGSWWRTAGAAERWTVLGGIAAVVGVIVALLAWLLPQSAAPAAIAPPSTPALVTMGPTDAVSPPEAPPSDGTPSTDPASEETPSSSGGTSVPHGPVTYSTVDLRPLCDSGDCGGTQQVGNTIFAYTDEAEACTMPRYCEHKAFQQGATTCRSLDVQFAGDQWAQEDGHPTVDHLKIIQQSLAPIYATVKVGKIGKVHIPLDGGPLIINAAVENDPGVHNSYVLLKVTGSCSTPDGLPA